MTERNLGKPAFDLIIGTDTMPEIILDFKEKIITIDEIKLPMQNIKDLLSSNKVALSYQNCLVSVESRSTELATQRILKILDAKYEKDNLPELVKTNC